MKNRMYKISLFSMILACSATLPGYARVNIRNHSANMNSYNKIITSQQQNIAANTNVYVTTASATDTLPVAVDDPTLAENVLNNTSDSVNTEDLENCSMIYPNGLFKWAIPESGIRQTPLPQCVAMVELRDVNTNAVLAKTTLASGDIMKCNIDMFPQSGWQNSLSNVELPADDAPTLEDVEKVMNEEQKQNAGLKIAAAAILTGLAGNMLAPKEAGDTKLLGTNKEQLIDTAIAATAGAGVMAASTYSGKIAGDTIKSTAVNAAAGAVVGNMAGGIAGGGESTLSIKKCVIEQDGTKHEKDCIAGDIDEIDENSNIDFSQNKPDNTFYLINDNSQILECKKGQSPCTTGQIQVTDDPNYTCCSNYSKRLVNIKLSPNSKDTFESFKANNEFLGNDVAVYDLSENESKKTLSSATNSPSKRTNFANNQWIKIYSADVSKGKREHAYAVFDNDLANKFFGYKVKDWADLKKQNTVTYYGRNPNGSVGRKREEDSNKKIVFTPSEVDADNDVLVDFSNAGRAKATMTGAAAGGAIGGFAGYQGAKQEVQERYVTAIREYNDSLTNFYCATGTRFLSKYNDYIEIPQMQKSE